MNSTNNILIVEDHAVQSMVLCEMIKNRGDRVVDMVDRGEEAISRTLELKPDLIIMDIFLNGDMTGIEAMQQIRVSDPGVPVIFISGNSDPFYLRKAERIGCVDFFYKPVSSHDLSSTIEKELTNTLPEKTKQVSGIKQIWPINLFV